jgi:hypothetical protein
MPEDLGAHQRIDVFLHWPKEPLRVTVLPPSATHAVLTVKEEPMPASVTITVDDQGATASLSFVDRLGEATSAPVSVSDGSTPVVVAFTGDNDAVATVDATSGVLTPVAAGTVNVGATVNDANDGTPALEPDGQTPFAPAPVNVTVNPGAAASDVFTVTP